MLNKEQH